VPRVRINRTAASDLEFIQSRGLEEFGAIVADDFMEGFDLIFARLETYPLLGRSMPEYGRAVRSCSHAPYRVLYRYEAEVVSILRVLHTSMRAFPIDNAV
jgi:plasmid stabilization system protein ParE